MVIIIKGSVKDSDWSSKIAAELSKFKVKFKIYTASAHKTPDYLLTLIRKFEKTGSVVYICVAGRSNALGGFVDANTLYPVINCPPQNSSFSGLDVLSSLRMPTGVSALTVLEPEQSALAAAKILGLSDGNLKNKISKYQQSLKDEIIKANKT